MADMFGTVDRMRNALDYHVSRHNVVASNIANAETPGFHPLELVRDEPDAPSTLRMAVTAEGHVGFNNGDPSAPDLDTREDRHVTPAANGNSVSLEHEMSKLAANDIRYEGAVKIVTHQIAMLRYASNDGNGG